MSLPTDTDSETESRFSTNSVIHKQTQNFLSAEIQSANKHSRKNGSPEAPSGGDITAALMKRKIQNTKSVEQLPGVWSPKSNKELTISTPKMHLPSLPLGQLSSGVSDVSPSSTSTNGWTNSVFTHNYSLDNLTSLGESSPGLSDGGRISDFGWRTREQREIPQDCPSLVSSPSDRRRSLSYKFDEPQNLEIHSQALKHPARRSFMYSQSQFAPIQYPQQNQAQFSDTSDVDLMLPPNPSGPNPCDIDYYCGFDVLLKENVVIIGHDSGLEIQAITKKGLSTVCELEGLRGAVYNAKILPWTTNTPNSDQYPMVVLVVHGPAMTLNEVSQTRPIPENILAHRKNCKQGSSQHANTTTVIEYYQTTVELYSLSPCKKKICTLLSLPKVPYIATNENPNHRAPSSVGSLSILADCGNLVVSSGTTGETWVFNTNISDGNSNLKFKCIAKVWTTVQHGVAIETNSQIVDDLQSKEPSRQKKFHAPIVSINGRWLAYCPPADPPQTYLRAFVAEAKSSDKVPGLSSQAPPPLPEVNCGTDMLEGESVMKQIAQIGTQNFIKAGTYLAQQGIQAWTNYRNKPASTTQKVQITHPVPTTPASLITKDPGLVSVLDLDILAQNVSSPTISSPHPLFTFRVPHGCSYLSFSPNGLSLLTASSKGDIQIVWDLMPAQQSKPLENRGNVFQGPHVRQIAQFSRMTVARIVDVVWTFPHGERAAMVTEPGTIHILDLPVSALTWPPSCRKPISPKNEKITTENDSLKITPSVVATHAVNTLWTAARPIVSGRRRSSTSLSARSITTKASHSTQALAAGISRSVGAATGKMNEIRKSVVTKHHLPRNSATPSKGCVIILKKKRNDLIIALSGGVVRLYTIKDRRPDQLDDKQKLSVKMFVEHKILPLSIRKFSADSNLDTNTNDYLRTTKTGIHKKSRPKAHGSMSHRSIYSIESSIPQAEIESNAPYQPFHIDRRMSLYAYSDQKYASNDSRIMMDNTGAGKQNHPWVFGLPISTNRIDVVSPSKLRNKRENFTELHVPPSAVTESVMRASDSAEEFEEMRITTGSREKSTQSNVDLMRNENGFFEDDCEMLDFTN
ncbi:hypothetical protein GcM3_010003 [Golovinomyces cichoracearum]|uniref:Uncharacterized protein n=1 Tax=Golovinomyces cichoracearum TaxID=62708 RepID=A0A420JA31_9PEZI|nr:hypothetical protein GcM3_010003 [Golovinomyces cichoracearum]